MSIETTVLVFKKLFLRTDESGQTLVEYSLVLGLIVIASIIGVTAVAGSVDSLWSYIGDEVTNAVGSVLT